MVPKENNPISTGTDTMNDNARIPMPCRLLCKDQWEQGRKDVWEGICWLDVFLTGIDFKDSQRDWTALKL